MSIRKQIGKVGEGRWRRDKGARKQGGEKPKRLAVGAATQAARQFRAAVRWWQEVLREGASVPLAPRLHFPELGERGCAFVFTDAAREDSA